MGAIEMSYLMALPACIHLDIFRNKNQLSLRPASGFSQRREKKMAKSHPFEYLIKCAFMLRPFLFIIIHLAEASEIKQQCVFT